MRLAPPKPIHGDDAPQQKRSSSFQYFFRVLKLTWPHRRLVAPAIGCILIVAVSFSASIAAILPVLQAIIQPESVPTWIHRTVAADRLGADVQTFVDLGDEPALRPFGGRVQVTGLHARSALRGAVTDGQVPLFIVGLDGRALPASQVYRELALAAPDQALALQFVSKSDIADPDAARTATVRLSRRPDAMWRAAMAAGEWLPQGNSRDEKIRTLVLILAVMFTVTLIGGAARFGGEYLTAIVAGRTLIGLRRRMYRKLLRLPVSFFAQRGSSDVISRFVQDSQDIYRGLTYIFVQSIREPLKAIGTFMVALYVNWRITLLAVIIAPAAGLLLRTFGRSIRKRSRRLLQGYGRMLQGLEGALTGIRVVKAYGGESYERRHLYSTDWQIFRAQAGIERIEALTSPLFEVVGYFLGSVVAVYFADQVIQNRLEPGEFMLIIVCLGAMFDPIRKLSSFYNRIERANAAAERIFEIVDMPDEVTNTAAHALPPLREAIELRGLTFTYPGAERPAVTDVNLSVRRGERVAIVGPNGSGKTTLVSLLMRFFEPQRGAILFDGLDIRQASLQSVRRQIGLVTQDSVMFADTVRNNIAYGDPTLLWKLSLRQRHPQRNYPRDDGGEVRVVAAAKAAFADEFISRMPQGYDTLVGEHGATLSGGQKQRLSIARAILANAPVLVFDEATSQIDSDSEQKIHDALERFLQDRTAFIIAHRFSTILQADRIVVMDQGRVIDSGKHDELMTRCGLYRTLFETQLQPLDRAAG